MRTLREGTQGTLRGLSENPEGGDSVRSLGWGGRGDSVRTLREGTQ